jgi:hypothetical protein
MGVFISSHSRAQPQVIKKKEKLAGGKYSFRREEDLVKLAFPQSGGDREDQPAGPIVEAHRGVINGKWKSLTAYFDLSTSLPGHSRTLSNLR